MKTLQRLDIKLVETKDKSRDYVRTTLTFQDEQENRIVIKANVDSTDKQLEHIEALQMELEAGKNWQGDFDLTELEHRKGDHKDGTKLISYDYYQADKEFLNKNSILTCEVRTFKDVMADIKASRKKSK